MNNNIYSQSDFRNLTNSDLEDITKALGIKEIPDDDKYNFLFSKLEQIEKNDISKKIMESKILAGQTSVRWYKFSYSNAIEKDKLVRELEEPLNGFQRNLSEWDIVENEIACIVKEGSIYTCKICVYDGYTNYQNGLTYERRKQIDSIIVKIDIDNCWIELRCAESKCKTIEQILASKLGLVEVYQVPILKKYENDIIRFKEELHNGYFMKYSAKPAQPIELTQEDSIALAEVIKTIDRYLQNKDVETLIKELEKINFDTENLSIISILLSDIDSMGMKIRRNSDRDMSGQTLYTLLKEHIEENSNYIKFTDEDGLSEYTIVVGRKSNTISFRTSVTEDVLSYIRNLIL